jgi:hypothetical protein
MRLNGANFLLTDDLPVEKNPGLRLIGRLHRGAFGVSVASPEVRPQQWAEIADDSRNDWKRNKAGEPIPDPENITRARVRIKARQRPCRKHGDSGGGDAAMRSSSVVSASGRADR